MENERFKRKVLTSLGGIIVCILLEMIYYTLPIEYQTLQTYTTLYNIKLSSIICQIELEVLSLKFSKSKLFKYFGCEWLIIAFVLEIVFKSRNHSISGIFLGIIDFLNVLETEIPMEERVIPQKVVRIPVVEKRADFSVKCHTCRLDYGSHHVDRIPQILPQCGHTVCHGCIQRIIRSQQSVSCPFCGVRFFRFENFKNNFAVLEVIEKELSRIP
ncbi:hypothetical protein GCK72_011287 [Caenorhabditis remanei]|uniref:RING-type domain-containing protein n=1 Tax=Caenorhabditis remanei TaxID=31234 RepID=A0A6A5H9D6_CAERE|nr:hypothetical protein GCK72_011287 [Caenorhabditis remanei]KAF1763022.1 hypothetical protein GCK72_011287 [Caenorhabditis remanei]